MNALKAKEFFRQDVQYIVRNGKALIINEVIRNLVISVIHNVRCVILQFVFHSFYLFCFCIFCTYKMRYYSYFKMCICYDSHVVCLHF